MEEEGRESEEGEELEDERKKKKKKKDAKETEREREGAEESIDQEAEICWRIRDEPRTGMATLNYLSRRRNYDLRETLQKGTEEKTGEERER